jgi:hypothetical protein
MTYKEFIKEFIISSLLGLISSVFYLISSYELDKVMSYNESNIIGLTIDHISNFILQQLFFKGHLRDWKKYIIAFSIGNIVTICYSQIVFILLHKYIEKHYPKFYKNKWKKYVSLIRYFSGVISYPLTFALRKYYIFK